MNDIVAKYEIRGVDGNFIQVGETEDKVSSLSKRLFTGGRR